MTQQLIEALYKLRGMITGIDEYLPPGPSSTRIWTSEMAHAEAERLDEAINKVLAELNNTIKKYEETHEE